LPDKAAESTSKTKDTAAAAAAAEKPLSNLKVLSWNIDGLHDTSLNSRMPAIIAAIKQLVFFVTLLHSL
jgi:hypothetical protein